MSGFSLFGDAQPVKAISFKLPSGDGAASFTVMDAVTVKAGGAIELAEGVTLDAAAQIFWQSVARMMPSPPTPAELAAIADEARAWRAEAVHRRWLHIDTIDRVPVDLLIALVDHAFPAATSGFVSTSRFVMRAFDDPPKWQNEAEQAWANVWKQHDLAKERD